MYPAAGLLCGSSSCSGGTLTLQACDGMGACGMTPTACLGGYLCAGPSSCASSCGTTAGTAGCQATYYCDGVAPGACKPQGGPGASCSQDYECQSGMCNQAGGTQCM
jgi:hypothetical protein